MRHDIPSCIFHADSLIHILLSGTQSGIGRKILLVSYRVFLKVKTARMIDSINFYEHLVVLSGQLVAGSFVFICPLPAWALCLRLVLR